MFRESIIDRYLWLSCHLLITHLLKCSPLQTIIQTVFIRCVRRRSDIYHILYLFPHQPLLFLCRLSLHLCSSLYLTLQLQILLQLSVLLEYEVNHNSDHSSHNYECYDQKNCKLHLFVCTILVGAHTLVGFTTSRDTLAVWSAILGIVKRRRVVGEYWYCCLHRWINFNYKNFKYIN